MRLEPGAKLGNYEILAPIGEGGMGVVYRARDARLHREVALKVLAPALSANPDALSRFEREARAVAALSHPNILGIYDSGSERGIAYAATELLEGETLRERLNNGAIPARKALPIAQQIAQGLAAAHEKGIIHRDLKPANIFLTEDGHLKILDFGLAKVVIHRPVEADVPTIEDPTEPGTVMGTAGYMSPEQVRGRPLDHRADIFSFGVVLYEMLSGKRAFARGTAVETMAAILHDDPPEIDPGKIEIAPALGRIIQRCLEKRPEDRFQSTRDLVYRLQEFTFDSANRSSPATLLRPKKIRQRARALLPALAGGALLGVVATLAIEHFRKANPAQNVPPNYQYLTYSGHDWSPDVSPDGKTLAFCSDRDGSPRIWVKQLKGGNEVALTAGSDDFPRFSPDGTAILFTREEGTHNAVYKVALLGGEPQKLIDDAADADWSPEGGKIVFMRWRQVAGKTDSEVMTAAADGSGARVIARLPAARILAHPRWSPDGKTIAISAGVQQAGQPQSLLLLNADGSGARTLPAPRAVGAISAAAWAGSRQVIYSQADSVIGSNAGSSARIVEQNISSGKSLELFWSPSASLLVDLLPPRGVVFDARSSRQNLREISPAGRNDAGSSEWLTRGNSTDRQPAYTPSGKWVIFSSARVGQLNLWEVSTATRAIRRLTDDSAEDWDPGISADGKTLLFSSNRSGHFEIWTAQADGSGAEQLTHDGLDAENPAMTPDGQWIVYASGNPDRQGVWKIRRDGTGAVRLVPGDASLPEVSPDGKYFLYRTTPGPRLEVIHVARLDNGASLPFEIRIDVRKITPATLGRARWMPGEKAIAFIGQDQYGTNGIYEQDFSPLSSTDTSRRPLGGFDREAAAESFGVSPDGRHLIVAALEQLYSVMEVEGAKPLAMSPTGR